MSVLHLAISESLALHELQVEDAGRLFHVFSTWRNEMVQGLPFVAKIDSEADCRAYIEGLCPDRELVFGIWLEETFVGCIGLSQLDFENKRGESGYWLSPEFQHRGIMTEVLETFLVYCGDILGLHRLTIRCAKDNLASLAIVRKFGFTHEGTERDGELRADGRFVDLEVFSLLDL